MLTISRIKTDSEEVLNTIYNGIMGSLSNPLNRAVQKFATTYFEFKDPLNCKIGGVKLTQIRKFGCVVVGASFNAAVMGYLAAFGLPIVKGISDSAVFGAGVFLTSLALDYLIPNVKKSSDGLHAIAIVFNLLKKALKLFLSVVCVSACTSSLGFSPLIFPMEYIIITLAMEIVTRSMSDPVSYYKELMLIN